MRRREIVTVYSHTRGHLETLISEALELPDITIDRFTLGGMTNVNLLARSDDTAFVVRIPALNIKLPSNHYENEFRVCNSLSQNGLSPEPLGYGTLSDERLTPFMAYHYAPGTVHFKVGSMSQKELEQLRHFVEKLSSVKVAGVPVYSSAIEYQHHLLEHVNSVNAFRADMSADSIDLIDSFHRLHDSLLPITESVDWTQDSMHGDLHPRNIVFQDNGVLFLDWNEFCRGEAFYDLVYLFSEPIENPPLDLLSLLSSRNLADLNAYRGLAFFSVISWTTERLIRCELGHVDLSLSDKQVVSAMKTYLRDKSDQLEQVIAKTA